MMLRSENVDYNFRWTYYNEKDFELWRKKFKSNRTWQKKYTRKGHIWYNHNSVRFKQNCELAKPEVRRCCGKLKVPMHKGENGTFIVLFNEDGCKHFLSEFYTSFYNGLYRDSFDDMAMSVREQIWKEFFNRSYSNASIDKNVGSTTTATNAVIIDSYANVAVVQVEDANSNNHPNNNHQTEKEREKNDWDELSRQLMESLQISLQQNPVGNSRYASAPPIQIISVCEDNDRIDWELVRTNSSLRMVIARSSIGLKIDKEFHNNFQSMLIGNFEQIGVYHHFLGGTNSPTPEEQLQMLDRMLDSVGFNKQMHLFGIAVQTEHNADFDRMLFTARLVVFINLVLQNNFMRPIIYCNNNSWQVLIEPGVADELFSKLPLWIARFTDEVDSPPYPDTWKSRQIPWWMWQHTDMGLLHGIINHVFVSRRNDAYTIEDELFRSAV